MRKNENPFYCRFTIIRATKYVKGKLYIIVVTDNDKKAKIPKGYKQEGKSFVSYRNALASHFNNYPYGKDITNGAYVLLSDNKEIKEWQRIKL